MGDQMDKFWMSDLALCKNTFGMTFNEFVCRACWICVCSLCVLGRYTGSQPTTNMVIVDIKLLSGFIADPSSLDLVRWLK